MVKSLTQHWEPANACKPKDNIISSRFRDYVPVKPIYEQEQVNMFLLLAHDYGKLWKAQNVALTVRRYEFAGEAGEHLCRRYVLRAFNKKKTIKEEQKPRFIMKRFRNIPSKVRQYMGFPISNGQLRHPQLETKDDITGGLASAKDSNEILKTKTGCSSQTPVKTDFEIIASVLPETLICKGESRPTSPSTPRTNLHCGDQSSSKGSEFKGHAHVLCVNGKCKVKNVEVGMPHNHVCGCEFNEIRQSHQP